MPIVVTARRTLNLVYFESIFQLRCLLGLASRSVEFKRLRQEVAYYQLEHIFKRCFDGYRPTIVDPVRMFYSRRGLEMPSEADLHVQTAICAAEFVLLLQQISRHQLSPRFFTPLIQPDEITKYVELTEQYLRKISAGDGWPISFFYEVASEVMHKRFELNQFDFNLESSESEAVLIALTSFETMTDSKEGVTIPQAS